MFVNRFQMTGNTSPACGERITVVGGRAPFTGSLAIAAGIVVPIGATMIWFGWQEYKKVVYADEV